MLKTRLITVNEIYVKKMRSWANYYKPKIIILLIIEQY